MMIDGVGLNLTSLKDGDIDGADALIGRWKALGCSDVELTARRLDLVVNGRLNVHRARQVIGLVEKHAIRPVLHAPHAINLMDLPRHDWHVAVCEASIEFCRLAGAQSMVVHSGKVPTADWVGGPEKFRMAEREALKRLGDLAGRAAVRLAVENMIASPRVAGGGTTPSGADPRRLAEQLDAVGHEWVGACLDFGHAWLSSTMLGFDYAEALRTFAPFVWHLHLHDNCGKAPRAGPLELAGDDIAYGIGDMHAPMYWGTIPWNELLPKLTFRERTFAGVELAGRFNHEAASVVETAWTFARFLNGEGQLANPYEDMK